jgi:hypothetical protein
VGTIFGQTLFFFVAELWITRPSSLGTRGLKTTYSMQKPIAFSTYMQGPQFNILLLIIIANIKMSL